MLIGTRTMTLALLFLSCLATAGELPDAPHLKMRGPIETYGPDERMIVHNSPSAFTPVGEHRVFDWQFVAVHGVYAGALAFDLALTSRGVGNGCEEASSNLGPHPSNNRIVAFGLAEFSGVVALDAGMKALARYQRIPRWLATAGGSLGAGIGIVKHLRGGMAWTRTACL